MSSLVLVRHAQASLFSNDYDRLSDLGRTQARKLGEYWLRHGLTFDEVHVGPRARQQDTAKEIAAVYGAAGRAWPEPQLAADLDEYDLDGLFNVATHLAKTDPAFAALVARYRETKGVPGERERHFQRVLEFLTLHWLAAGKTLAGMETWPAFRQRVGAVMKRLTRAGRSGRRVACFTSGGFIGTALHIALATQERMALEVSWRIRNCSWSEFLFTQGRLTPDGFNAVPHLEDPALWTYR
jgi:broad specificity phosphatase PhoE